MIWIFFESINIYSLSKIKNFHLSLNIGMYWGVHMVHLNELGADIRLTRVFSNVNSTSHCLFSFSDCKYSTNKI